MQRQYWKGYCNLDRTSGITQIQDRINKYGSIDDFKFFSDISISIVVEIDSNKIEMLYTELGKILDLDKEDKTSLSVSNTTKVLLNITFTKGKGNMRNEVIAVPG